MSTCEIIVFTCDLSTYVASQHNHRACQHNHLQLHVDINKSHVNRIMLHVDINYLTCRGWKYATFCSYLPYGKNTFVYFNELAIWHKSHKQKRFNAKFGWNAFRKNWKVNVRIHRQSDELSVKAPNKQTNGLKHKVKCLPE